MADIAATDVTTTLISNNIHASGFRDVVADMAFGDGALTYPTGGVPLTKGDLGSPNSIRSFTLVEPDAGNGFVYKFDASAESLRIYQGDNDNVADAPLIELVGGVATPALATVRANVIGF